MVNNENKNSFVCPSKTLDIKNSTLIINKDETKDFKRRRSIINKVYNLFNQFYANNNNKNNYNNKNNKLKIPENEMRNRFSAQIDHFDFKESIIKRKEQNSQSVIQNNNFEKKKIIKTKKRRIIFINNNIFCSMKIKKFSVIDIDKFKNSKFYDYISQSSLFIFCVINNNFFFLFYV